MLGGELGVGSEEGWLRQQQGVVSFILGRGPGVLAAEEGLRRQRGPTPTMRLAHTLRAHGTPSPSTWACQTPRDAAPRAEGPRGKGGGVRPTAAGRDPAQS